VADEPLSLPDEPRVTSAFSAAQRGLIGLVLSGLLVSSVLLSLGVIRLREGGTLYEELQGCLAFTMSEAAAPGRVPAALWPCSLYAMGLFFLAPLRVNAERQRVRDGALRLVGLIAGACSLVPPLISLWTVGALCSDQLAFQGLNVLLLVALFARGPRRLVFPLGVDGIGALFLFVTVTGSFFQGVLIAGSRFERVAYQAAARENKVAAVAELQVPTVWRPAGQATLPIAGRTPPVDRYDLIEGAAQAPVRVVAFVDLVNPTSRAHWEQLRVAAGRWSDRVSFVVKVLPANKTCNPLHVGEDQRNACEAAVALFCAARLGPPQAYASLLFRHQDRLGQVGATELAVEAALPAEAFRQCVRDQGFAAAIQEDATHAGYLGLTEPALFVGDLRLPADAPPTLLESLIRHALGELPLDAQGQLPLFEEVVDEPAPPASVVAPLKMYYPGHIFWIDGVRNSVMPSGRRQAQIGEPPALVEGVEAAKLCAAWGQRLCLEEEWIYACSGSYPVDNDGDRNRLNDRHEGRAYPYGSLWRPGWCASDPSTPTGALPGCRSPEGVRDMVGGAPEWVVNPSGRLMLSGGAGGVGDTCQRQSTASEGARAAFRCCQDKPPR
jgi:protein-disulfide isomerase